MLYLDGAKARFSSKQQGELARFARLAAEARDILQVWSAIFEGEVVVIDGVGQGRRTSGASCPIKATSITRPFDVLWLNGKDLRGLPLTRRRRELDRLIPATTTVVSKVFAVEQRGRDLFAAAERLDREGIVAKRKADPYAPGTTSYKIKNRGYTQLEGQGDLFHPRSPLA